MKKLYSVFLLMVVMMMISACSSGEYAGSSEPASGSENPKETENSSKGEEKKEEAKLEVIDTAGGSWKDSIDSVWVHSAAVYKNTGNVPVSIGETQLTYKAQDGSVMGTSSMVYSVPDVIQPGETAFVGESTILEGAAGAEEYKETGYNYSFDKVTGTANIVEVSGVKGIKGDMFTPYKVTGLVKNTTDEKQDDIRIAAGLFDASGKLLGVLKGSVDVGLNAGGEAGFELSYPDIPADAIDKIATIEVKAYAWTW